MSEHWNMLTLVGADRPGIVAEVTRVLYGVGAQLGEASMMRLGNQFAIMMMVRDAGTPEEIAGLLESVRDAFGLRIHVDDVDAALHQHHEPDVMVTVHGADRSGIVSEVAGALVEAGLNILDLRSDVGGTPDAPIYVMQIEGEAGKGLESIETAVAELNSDGLSVRMTPIDTVRG